LSKASSTHSLSLSLSHSQSQVVSIERVAEFATMQSEPPLRVASSAPPPSWPSDGEIELRRFSMAYRRGLPRVLDDVSCVIHAREKVGAMYQPSGRGT
jgi:ATP-binding cassette subfamily C (CFTR/MRP) protein 1